MTKERVKVDRNKQFQKCITIRLVSVSDWLTWVDKQRDVLHGRVNKKNKSGDDDDDGNRGGMDDNCFIDFLFLVAVASIYF